MESFVLPAVFLTGVAWLGTIFRVSVRRRLDLLDWFVVALGSLNGVSYAFIIWATLSGLNPYWAPWILPYSEYYWVFPVVSLIALLGVWLGGTVAKAMSLKRAPMRELTRKTEIRIKKLAWTFLFLAILAYRVYTRAYGGFIGLLKYSSLIRSGLFEQIGISNPWSFLQRLGGLAFFSSFLFYALLISKCSSEKRVRGSDLLGLLASICFSLYVLYSWLGRVAMVTYCVVFPLGYVYYRYYRRPGSLIVRIVAFIVVGAVALPLLSLWMTPGKASKSFVEFYARELSFPAVSFFVTVDSAKELRFGQDILVAPVYFLPERIWRGLFKIETASDVNTQRIYGYRKGEGGVTGGIPTDIVTFAYMQAGVIGVVLISFLLGAVLVWLDRLILRLPGTALRMVIYAYSALMVSALTVLYADPIHIIHRNLHFIVGTAMLFMIVPRFRPRSINGRRNEGGDGLV